MFLSAGQPPQQRARERALRLFESVEDLVSDVLLTARDPARASTAEEAVRLAAEAEHAVLTELGRDPEGLAATLVRIRRKVRGMAEDLDVVRRPTPPRSITTA